MREQPKIDQRETDLWLWRHGQGERGDRAPLVRFLARGILDQPDASDAEVDFALDIAWGSPDWLAIRTLPDGRFAGVMPAIDGYGILGVNHPPGHPCAEMGVFATTWEYEQAINAIAALNAWDPALNEEPTGYLRRSGT